jgi:lysophospholipase L1-like esterase
MRPDAVHVVTFGGQMSGMIAAGAPLLSDPVELSVSDFDTLSISIYLPGETGQCTCHQVGLQTAYVSGQGDFTSTRFATDDTIQARAFLSGVDVYSIESRHVIVTLGDSITDGVGSTPDTNNRWPDGLAERLAEREGDSIWSVVNAGIAGNRMLSDGAGESALARFDRDVLAVPGVTHVIVFEGINDIGFALGRLEGRLADYTVGMPRGEVTEEAMIAGYRQLISRAHANGLMILGATITPYNGSQYFSIEGEKIRQIVNQWIRDSGEFDAVFDFDAVLRDPSQPSQIAEGLHSGDFLHGSDAGYQRIADSIDLGLFE